MDTDRTNIPIIRKPTITRVDNTSLNNKDTSFNDAQNSFFQKNKLALIAATISILLFVGIYLYFTYTQTPQNTTTTPETKGELSGGVPVENKPKEPSINSTNTSPFNDEISSSRPDLLKKVWSKAVSGQTIIYDGVGTSTIVGVVWADKATGNIYKAYEPDWSPLRITNTTIPNTINAVFLNNGNTVVLEQYNKEKNTINTIIADIPRTNNGAGDSLTNMSNLSDNIKSLDVSKDGTRLYLVVGLTNGSAIYQMDPSDKKPEQIISSPISDLEVKYLDKDNLILYQRPSSVLQTSAYKLNIKNKKLNLIYKDYGLTVLGDSDKFIYNTNLNTYTEVNNQKTKRISNTIVADKCKISNSSSFVICANPKNIDNINIPDDWYDYSYYTNDSLVLYGLDYEEYTFLSDLSTASGESFDVDSINISNNNNYISMSNRYGSLYVFNLSKYNNQ